MTDEEYSGYIETPILRTKQLQERYLRQSTIERKVYDRLAKLQKSGNVPTYLGSFQMIPSIPTGPKGLSCKVRSRMLRWTSVSGCLLSYVTGYKSEDVVYYARTSDWRAILQGALDTKFADFPSLSVSFFRVAWFALFFHGAFRLSGSTCFELLVRISKKSLASFKSTI